MLSGRLLRLAPWVPSSETRLLLKTTLRPALASLLVLLGLIVAPRPALADTTNQLKQVQARQRAVKVQLNLAVASADAVVAEANRLAAEVTSEQALVGADQSAVSAADAQASVATARIASLAAQGGAARQALVNRAIDLYEHPFQTSQLLLSGVTSLDDLTTRQVFTDAVQARTSDLIDAVRGQRLLEEAASRDLRNAQSLAQQRTRDAQDELGRLKTAEKSAQEAHVALVAKINDDDASLVALGKQESQLEGLLNAASAQYASTIGAIGPVGSFGLQWPIHGIVTQEFGHNGHPGIDIAAAYGTPIAASGSGVVIYAGWESGYGNYTCIAHGGPISTCYGHQSQIVVSVGQTVSRGQYIGNEGSTGYSTGPHVHFEVRVNGGVRNPRLFIPGNP
jgi:murein DD-endopeptidase MepM/ murein hydrolase activator NlpD